MSKKKSGYVIGDGAATRHGEYLGGDTPAQYYRRLSADEPRKRGDVAAMIEDDPQLFVTLRPVPIAEMAKALRELLTEGPD